MREGSKTHISDSIKHVQVDWSSSSSLEEACKSQDAVISTLGYLAEAEQTRLMEAAVAAGVKRFIPSEFGVDLLNEKGKALPVFAGKVAAQKYLEGKAKAGEITYTFLANGLYLDWGLMVGIIADVKNKKAELYDGGDVPFSVSRTTTVGEAVVTILKKYEETKNKIIRIQEASITQNQIINIAKKLGGDGDWETTAVDTVGLEETGHAELRKSEEERDPFWRYLFIKRGIWGGDCGGEFSKTADNALLDVKHISDSDIEEVVKSYM